MSEKQHFMKWHRENAIIESTTLGWEDHGIFTFGLRLDYGGSGQTAGNMCLSWSPRDLGHEVFGDGALSLIAQTMKTVGVREWENMKGKHIVALLDAPYGTCKGIAHFLGKGDDLVFQEYMEAQRAVEVADRLAGVYDR